MLQSFVACLSLRNDSPEERRPEPTTDWRERDNAPWDPHFRIHRFVLHPDPYSVFHCFLSKPQFLICKMGIIMIVHALYSLFCGLKF